MKIAGYNIRSMSGKNIIISTAKENGYPSNLMITVVRDGSVVAQTVCLNNQALNVTAQIKAHNKIYPEYNWVSRLNVNTINKNGNGLALVGRNLKKSLYPLV